MEKKSDNEKLKSIFILEFFKMTSLWTLDIVMNMPESKLESVKSKEAFKSKFLIWKGPKKEQFFQHGQTVLHGIRRFDIIKSVKIYAENKRIERMKISRNFIYILSLIATPVLANAAGWNDATGHWFSDFNGIARPSAEPAKLVLCQKNYDYDDFEQLGLQDTKKWNLLNKNPNARYCKIRQLSKKAKNQTQTRATGTRRRTSTKWTLPAGAQIITLSAGDTCARGTTKDAKAKDRKVDFYIFYEGEDTSTINKCAVASD